jgi:membrane protein DedA with SNARE-associated domain
VSNRAHNLLVAVIVVSAAASIFFGLRSYGSFLLLRSAYEVGQPEVSSLRAWMTLDHVAATYRVAVDALLARLGLPADTDRKDTLKGIADRRGISRFEFVREVQRAIGDTSAAVPPPTADSGQGPGGLTDRILSALLVYGYPALAATLLLGAVGLPLPIGVAAVLAGSLAALGTLRWEVVAAVAVLASFAGDLIAYGIGRSVTDDFLARHGRWIGYSPKRKDHIQSLLQRWGGASVIISRTLTSSLSSIVSLLAGVGRYPLSHFLGFALLGRLIWTSAYLGLGFAVGNNIDAASQFLANLSGLLVALGVLVVAAAYRAGFALLDTR